MGRKVILEWRYSPKDYFEDPIRIEEGEYNLEIDEGKIKASLDASVIDRNGSIANEIHDFVTNFFIGVQVASHKAYELSDYMMSEAHSNGRKNVTVFPRSADLVIVGEHVDLKVTDSAGRVVADTRAERIQEKKRFGDLAAKFRKKDPVAEAILYSYGAAVRDPGDEFVHLYEIRDRLKTEFGNGAKVRKALGISKSEWKRLGDLANDPEIHQGRHRGERIGQLRDATQKEKSEARSIAKKFILSYLEYLGKKTQ